MKLRGWWTAVLVLVGAMAVLSIIFLNSEENIRGESLCQKYGYRWRAVDRDGIFCEDREGRLIPPEKIWMSRPAPNPGGDAGKAIEKTN